MNSVIFEISGTQYNSSDFGMVLNPFKIPAAEPKTSYIDIEGASGSVDASEVFGLTFSSVEFSLDFTFLKYNEASFKLFKAMIHGRRGRLILSSDPDYFWNARFTVGETSGNGTKTVSVKCYAEPYKLKTEETVVNVSGNQTITLLNNVMKTVPTFECSAETQIVLGNVMVIGSIGKHVFPDIILEYGENELTIVTTGTVKISYQEGCL